MVHDASPSEPDGEQSCGIPITPLLAIVDAARGTLAADPIAVDGRRLRLLDTVDRRLAGRGWRLEAEPTGPDGSERWRLLSESGRVRAETVVPGPAPRLADDLPDGPMHQALEPLSGIRGLVASPWVTLQDHHCALRDADGKIRCRLVAQTAVVDGSGDRRSAVRVLPLKGYESDAERIAERITRRFGWSPTAPDPLSALAGVLHPEAGGTAYPAATDAAAPAGPALRPVLLALLDTVEHRAEGVIADIDCEELHDLRVAVRRTRSILSLLRAPEADPELDFARGFFGWLGQITGPTRDLDVHILAWRAHRRTASADAVADLAPLGRFLAGERDRAQAELVHVLRRRKFRGGVKRWRRALQEDAAVWSRSETMRQSIGALAGRRIRKLYRRALREGSAIAPDSPAEALHALRKTMKKLRYVIEIVRDAYPADRVRTVLRKLRELQQVLGDVQDMEVQADALRRFGQAMGDAGLAGPATLMAIGAQAEDLEIRRAAARTRFATVFAPVAGAKFAGRLRMFTRTGTGDDA